MQLTVELAGTTVVMSGDLTEKANETLLESHLSEAWTRAQNNELDSIAVDVGGLEHGNSSGLATWIRLTTRLAIPINYLNVPAWLVYQFVDVKDFLGHKMKISSFYAPYYCAEKDENTTILLTFGKNLALKKDYAEDDLVITQNNNRYLPDFEPSYFLSFVAIMLQS